MSGPTTAGAVAEPPAGSPDRSRLECRDCASRRPASESSPDAPAAAGSAPQQLILDLKPARFEDLRQLFDGDAVNARRPLVAHHCTQRRFYVVRITDRLHQ